MVLTGFLLERMFCRRKTILVAMWFAYTHISMYFLRLLCELKQMYGVTTQILDLASSIKSFDHINMQFCVNTNRF